MPFPIMPFATFRPSRPHLSLPARKARLLLGTAALLPLCALASPVLAQDSAQDADSIDTGVLSEIVVSAERLRGAADTAMLPVEQIDEADIATYGAGSVSELIEALGAQTGSGRGRGGGGRPVMLLNGRPVANFHELRDIPPEAIRQMQIFPEELALQYGYRPDQRVVNIILKSGYASLTTEAEVGGATSGAQSDRQFEVNFSRIGDKGRLNLHLEYQAQSLLTEDERGILSTATTRPASLDGTISAAVAGAEIDPTLSALAGTMVGSAIFPAGTTTPTLADFAATADLTGERNDSPYRSLLPQTDRFQGNISWTRQLSPGSELTLTGSYEVQDNISLSGLASTSATLPASSPWSPFSNDVRLDRLLISAGPLTRYSSTETAEGGASLNGSLGNWRWTWNNALTRTESDSRTYRGLDSGAFQAGVTAGTINPFDPARYAAITLRAPDLAESISLTAKSDAVLTGSPFAMPAGPAIMSVQAGYMGEWLDSMALTRGVESSVDLSRRTLSSGASIELPVTDPDYEVGGWLGKFALNANAGYKHLSDFGGLASYGGGFRWSPAKALTLSASWIGEEAAPDMAELGAPLIVTPEVSLYDFTTGQSVLIDRITGGNPALAAEQRRDLKLALQWEPKGREGPSLDLEYFRNRSTDVTASFPALTPAIEAAFAERVTRDATGRITTLDARPITYAGTMSDSLRLGINWRGSFKGGAGQAAGGQRRGGAEGAGGPMAMMGRGGGGGRWHVGLTYTHRLREEVRIRDGLAPLDLLNGDAIGAAGGASRHEAELEGGGFLSSLGMGMRASVRYKSGSHVNGNPVTQSSTLRFSDLATVNLRLFVRLGQQPFVTRHAPWLKGTQLRLGVENLFNAVQDVRDDTGAVPLAYQRGLMDPLGRVVKLSIRKQF